MTAVVTIVVLATCAVALALGGLARANFAAIDLHTRNRQAAEGRRHPLPASHHADALRRIRRRIVRWGTVGTAGFLTMAVAAVAASLSTLPPAWLTATLGAAAALLGALAGRGIGRAYAAALTRRQEHRE